MYVAAADVAWMAPQLDCTLHASLTSCKTNTIEVDPDTIYCRTEGERGFQDLPLAEHLA